MSPGVKGSGLRPEVRKQIIDAVAKAFSWILSIVICLLTSVLCPLTAVTDQLP